MIKDNDHGLPSKGRGKTKPGKKHTNHERSPPRYPPVTEVKPSVFPRWMRRTYRHVGKVVQEVIVNVQADGLRYLIIALITVLATQCSAQKTPKPEPPAKEEAPKPQPTTKYFPADIVYLTS